MKTFTLFCERGAESGVVSRLRGFSLEPSTPPEYNSGYVTVRADDDDGYIFSSLSGVTRVEESEVVE